jgi:hypothetical protein
VHAFILRESRRLRSGRRVRDLRCDACGITVTQIGAATPVSQVPCTQEPAGAQQRSKT